jgi:hypothetical protein
MMIRFNLIIVTMIIIAFPSLLYQQGLSVKQELKVQVWLADVKSNTGEAQVCVDIPETGASSCKKFDASASKNESLGLPSDPIIMDAGIYKLKLNGGVPENSTVIGCVYVFKDETGSCGKDKISPVNETHTMMLFTKVKPVFYDKETGRLYKYGQCYLQNNSGSKLCVEDEGVQFPALRK